MSLRTRPSEPAASAPQGPEPPLWPRVRRSLLFLTVLCTAIALFLTALDGRGLAYKLVYSFSIGLCCWLLTDALRFALTAWFERQRLRRGLAPSTGPVRIGWRGMLPLILLAALLGPGLGLTLGDAITGLRSPSLWSLDATASRVTLAISLLATVVSVFAGWMHERLTHAQAQAEAARRAQAESQLRLLQSQLEPHMLFNTLANLRVLIGLDATRAQAMLDRLIAYLRATLQASRAVEHPLAAEFERIADYLALMQVRMGPRLAVSLDLPAELRALPVPPLILQPLVENSIQHGLEPQVEGGRLTLSAALQSGRLRLTVRDDGIGLGAGGRLPHSTGFGLEQVRSRLHTLYGSAASLALSELPGERGTLAVIELPLPSPESTLTPSSTAP